MIRKWKPYIAAAICAIVAGQARAQGPRVATLDIEWENAVVYGDNLGDPSKFATSPDMVGPYTNVRNFASFIVFGDIISVNGKPARGAFVDGGRQIVLIRSPAPGQ